MTMNILLTNDDGIFAPGLWALEAALRELGRVTVVAPATEQSGVGHAITYRSAISAERVVLDGGRVGYALAGTPADCVKFGLLEPLDGPPDFVVSGINLGLNLGYNVFYSGTVAAAIEGAMNGTLSVAFSSCPRNADHLPCAAHQALRVLNMILGNARAPALAYNVNMPTLRDGEPDILFTHHRAMPFLEHYVLQQGETARTYQLDMSANEQSPPADRCDAYAIEAGMISVTPLRANLTDTDSLHQLQP